MTGWRRWATTSCIFTFTIAILFTSTTIQREFGHYIRHDQDFYVYFFTAKILQEQPGGDIYYSAFESNPQQRNASEDSPIFQKAKAGGVDIVMLYLYPPLTADILLPLTRLSAKHAAQTWQFINLLLVLFSVLALCRLMRIDVPSARFFLFLVAAYSFFPIIEAISVGQVAVLMLALWALSVTAYNKGYVVLSACALAFASTLKVTPILVIPLFFLWKERRWLLSYFGACAAIVFAMTAFNGLPLMEQAVKVLGAMGSSMPTLHNKCITAVVAWVYYGRFLPETEILPAPPHLLAIVAKLCSIGFYVASLFLVWRRNRNAGLARRTMIFATFALVSVLCSPIAWRHAYTVAVVPLALLWMQAFDLPHESQRATRHTLLLALTTIAVGTVAFDLGAGVHLPFALRIVLGAVWPLSSLLLCLDTLAGPRVMSEPVTA